MAGWTTLYVPTLHYPIPGGTIYSHNRADPSLWEVLTEGSPKLRKHTRCSAMGKPTYEEQRGKHRDGREEVCSSSFVFHLDCNEGRRASPGSFRGALGTHSEEQASISSSSHTPAPLWPSGLRQPTPPPPSTYPFIVRLQSSFQK